MDKTLDIPIVCIALFFLQDITNILGKNPTELSKTWANSVFLNFWLINHNHIHGYLNNAINFKTT